MSIVKVYSVRDAKLEAFMPPFYFPTNGMALRAFMDTVGDESSALAKHPSDFTLYELGSFDDSTGVFSMLSVPNPLGLASELLSRGQAV